jgi:hypothetical protein
MDERGCRMKVMRNSYNNFVGNMKERNHLEYQDVNSRINLLLLLFIYLQLGFSPVAVVQQ